LRRDKTIIELQEQVRKVLHELKQLKGSRQWNPYHWCSDINPIYIL